VHRDILLNLLHNIAGRREVDGYIRAFTEQRGPAYAVVKVGGALIEQSLDELAASLTLLRRVGMAPVVVHGAGPQLTRELDEHGVEPEWVEGRRVTTSEALPHVVRVLSREGARVASAIDEHGARARSITSSVFHAEPIDRERLGLVGRVERLDLAPVESAVEAGYIPVLSPLGTTGSGQILNINADDATRAIAAALRPRKILFLTPTGGILDEDGQIIQAINLAEDEHLVADAGVVSGGMARKIAEIGALLGDLPDHSSVSITAPEHVARELFTHRGCGTLVRKGVTIEATRGLGGVDAARLGTLLERSFGRALARGYWDRVCDAHFLIAGDYTAAAIVRTDAPIPYLDKLAVTEEAKGAGIGAALWHRLVGEFPALIWRSRAENAANGWYVSRAGGMRRCGPWLVFWTGGFERDRLEAGIRFARDQPVSFAEGVEPGAGETPDEAREVEHAS